MTIRLAKGVQFLTSGTYETGGRGRAYRDVLVAFPEVRNCAALATRQVRTQLVYGLFGIRWDNSGAPFLFFQTGHNQANDPATTKP